MKRVCAIALALMLVANSSMAVFAEEITSPAPSLTLRECFLLARRQSETIAISLENIEETEANFLQAASEALGDVNFEITNFRQENQGGSSEGSSGVGQSLTRPVKRERKFVINQPLFQGFRSFAALGGAGSLRKQRKEEKIRAEQLLFLDVSAAYYDLLSQTKNVEIINEILRLLEERITELKEREKIGRSRSSEVITAEARKKMIEAELATARGAELVTRHLLQYLTGVSLAGRKLEDEALPVGSVEKTFTPQLIPGHRPDVEASGQAVKTAWQAVIKAQSGLWPAVTLENNLYEKREGFQSGIDWDLLLKINIPLFQGGQIAGDVKQAINRWKKVKLAHAQTERLADLDVKQSYERWAASLEQSKALEDAVRASDENFRLQKEEYDRSLVSNLDVLDALEELYGVRRDANRVGYEVKQNYWRLQVAVGNCCESI